jgi:hypothetical protein
MGRPHIEPVTNASTVKDAPMGAVAAATAWPILMRQISAMAPATAIKLYENSDIQALGTCT